LFADGELFAAGPFLFGGLTLRVGGGVRSFFVSLLVTAAAAIAPSRPSVAADLHSLHSSLSASLSAAAAFLSFFFSFFVSLRVLMVGAGSTI
jgi:hypothetical protein